MPVTPPASNPLSLPPFVEYDNEKVWIEVFRDNEGVPIMDAAKQLPLKPQFDLVSICVYRVKRNVASYSNSTWRDQNNTLNLGTWMSAWEEGEAWCEVRPRIVRTSPAASYFELTYTIRCLRGGWKKLLPEAGYAYLDGSSLKDCVTDDGTVAIRKLSDTGTLLNNASPLVLTEKEVKRLVDFSFVMG